MDDILVRPSTDADVAQIAAIYAHHVLHGVATFETEPAEASEIARRRSDVLSRGLPWLVAEVAGHIQGYAYATPYRPRAAYRFTLEDSIYIHPDRIGQGIGKLLLPELIAQCEAYGAKQMIAIIGDTDNPASIRLHEKFGFWHAGRLHSVGFKFEHWLDTVLMQRSLGIER
jgi:phosphinothricin acetyltransferase